MRVSKLTEYTTRLLLAAVIGLASLSFFPATVQADTNPVDLVLGGEGATSWDISNIKPSDNGTKTVLLHNAGSKDGFVTIWVSDIISSEGSNPESETGDTTEPGELTSHLLFNLSGNRTSSNLILPTTFNNLPRGASDPKYIEVMPLKAGSTADLNWQWALPSQTGNDVQGDGVSFTINYLLREFEITDVSTVVTANGTFTDNVTVAPAGTGSKIAVNKDTVGTTKEGQPLSEIWIIDIDKEPSVLSPAKTTVGTQYDAGPHGTTFDRSITLTLTYDPSDIPAGARAKDLVIAHWDENTDMWVELEGCIIDTISNAVSVQIDHFSRYTIISPTPTPTSYVGTMSPPTVTEKPVTSVLETDMLGEKSQLD
ncbi:hypothetical protein ACFLT8_06830, partial [Chloroflexota bacterium]